MCNVVGKDSVLAISTREGQVQVYVLADEVQPAWDLGKPPQLTVDDKGHILAVGMLVNSSSVDEVSAMQHKGKLGDCCDSVWLGRIPPLLQLAVVDLALQPGVVDVGPVILLADPVVPERFYCQHAAGLDVILVQWLPFSGQNATKVSSEGPSPAVFPVLDIYTGVSTISQPLLGVTLVLDSLGESWIVAVTANCECAVINMKPHRTLPEPLVLGGNSNEEQDPGCLEVGVFQMMSKELLQGPKDIPFTKVLLPGDLLCVYVFCLVLRSCLLRIKSGGMLSHCITSSFGPAGYIPVLNLAWVDDSCQHLFLELGFRFYVLH